MAESAQRAATYEDLLAVPENMVAEILFGRLVTHPRPAPRHAVATHPIPECDVEGFDSVWRACLGGAGQETDAQRRAQENAAGSPAAFDRSTPCHTPSAGPLVPARPHLEYAGYQHFVIPRRKAHFHLASGLGRYG